MQKKSKTIFDLSYLYLKFSNLNFNKKAKRFYFFASAVINFALNRDLLL